jgi:hypothetical protein
MTHPLPSGGRAWRVAWLLVVGAALTPGQARGECGDYLTFHGTGAATGAVATPNRQHADMFPASEPGLTQTTAARLPARQPCRGPNCSKAPTRQAPPLPAPTAPGGGTVKEPAAAHLLAADAPSSPAALAWGLPSADPIRRPTSVYHPPRHG